MSDTQDAPWRALPEWPAFVEAAGWVLEESGTTEVLLGRADALCAAVYNTAAGKYWMEGRKQQDEAWHETYEAERARADRLAAALNELMIADAAYEGLTADASDSVAVRIRQVRAWADARAALADVREPAGEG